MPMARVPLRLTTKARGARPPLVDYYTHTHELTMIKIYTTNNPNTSDGWGFECPECHQAYIAESFSDDDYVYGYEEFECYECGTSLKVELTTKIQYTCECSTC